jgi:hypothetical protein
MQSYALSFLVLCTLSAVLYSKAATLLLDIEPGHATADASPPVVEVAAIDNAPLGPPRQIAPRGEPRHGFGRLHTGIPTDAD